MRTATEIVRTLNRTPRSDGQTLADLLCRGCAAEVPVIGAGLAVVTDAGHQGVLGASNHAAANLEQLQFERGEGPCLEAAALRSPLLVPDLTATGDRWPSFTPAALAVGVAATFCFPLHVGAVRLGILDLHGVDPGPLDPGQLARSQVYADAAVALLLQLQLRAWPGSALPLGLDPADDRALIHQATGVLAVRAGVDLSEALLLLRADAVEEGRALQESARAVVDEALNRGRGRRGPTSRR